MRIFPLKPSTRAIGAFRHTITVPAAPPEIPAPAPASQWQQFLDDSKWHDWVSAIFAWDGATWTGNSSGLNGGGLQAVGSWPVGYRPANLRLTLSCSTGPYDFDVFVSGVDGDDIEAGGVTLTLTVPTTPTQFLIPLDFTAVGTDNMDIDILHLFRHDNAHAHALIVHNIEFGPFP